MTKYYVSCLPSKLLRDMSPLSTGFGAYVWVLVCQWEDATSFIAEVKNTASTLRVFSVTRYLATASISLCDATACRTAALATTATRKGVSLKSPLSILYMNE